MDVFILMAAVTACYTLSSLSDKYAASEAKFRSDQYTFLVCAALSVFLACVLPFSEQHVTASWQSAAAVLLIAACKALELLTVMVILRRISVFELKAWLGVNLFVAYFTEVAAGTPVNAAKIGCIVLTAVGLYLTVRSRKSGREKYGKIILPLILYLFSRYIYSVIIKGFSPYISSDLQILFAMMLLALIFLFRVSPRQIFREHKKGALITAGARLPNAVGIAVENAVIAISITSYAFIQPMLLITLFVIDMIRRRISGAAEIAGSFICIAGIVLFEIF